jgi:bifunctional ADP-heptose synthase (sugar kinase/adenylyltransferase)
LALDRGRSVFVTLAERGIVAASPSGEVEHVPALPVRGTIDIVGAGDAVTANITSALAAGATLREALEMANAAASVVIHKLGTTGIATVAEIAGLVTDGRPA